jgi:hypothetical protein
MRGFGVAHIGENHRRFGAMFNCRNNNKRTESEIEEGNVNSSPVAQK